jgi:YidC/Oxa1 family membrane protein insertase
MNPNDEDTEQKSIILAFIVSLCLVMGFNYFFSAPVPKETAVVEIPASEMAAVVEKEENPSQTEDKDIFIPIRTSTLAGAVNLKGARLSELTLLKYNQTVKKGSSPVQLLRPAGSKQAYFADFVYLSKSKDKKVKVPTSSSMWQVKGGAVVAESAVLTEKEPLVLVYDNAEGLVFERTIKVDDLYMFSVEDKIFNHTGKPVELSLEGRIIRINPNMVQSSSVHEGFVGVLNDRLEEEKYKAVLEKSQKFTSTGGWLGFSDKYWLTALAYNPTLPQVQSEFSYHEENHQNVFTASYQTPVFVISAGEQRTDKTHFFAGPKEIGLLTRYMKTLDIDRFDLGIDFGWYYFLTKPFLYILEWINSFVGNMGVAILIFAFLIRLLLFPLAGKSYEGMAKMRKFQPKIKALQERYKDDKVRMNQEMMQLYQKEKVNPAAGCLPMLIQIPIFFSLYKVLSVSIQMRQAKFFGWIKDLSAPDTSSIFTLGGLVDWPIPNFLNIGIWPVLMGLTMLWQQKLTTPSSANDTDQTKAMRWMPIVFMFMFGRVASGLVIYWTWSNLLSIAQQKYIMYRYDKKEALMKKRL